MRLCGASNVDNEELLSELIECGLEVRACGMAVDDYWIRDSELIAGIEKGSMKALASRVKSGEYVIAFLKPAGDVLNDEEVW